MNKNPMNTIKIIAISAILASAGATFAHEPSPHGPMPAMAADQTDWGIAGQAGPATRTITITMHDSMRFSPASITVKEGETVRLKVRNSGRLLHELVLGTPAGLQAHAALMQKHPGMEHDEPYIAHVAAGKTGEIVWTFNRAGDFEFACLVNGHYQAGMKGRIRVAASQAAAAATPPMPNEMPQHAMTEMHHGAHH
jgi:uncharacterized cupredoxin-like copper-binding protein